MTSTPQSGYAPVNGLQMYYEIHGSGRPLLLLHGAFMTIEAFGPVLSGLAATRQVIAVEQQAHGRTADIDRPLSYEQMADDTAALLRYLNVPEADVVGYSMGGSVALQLALRYPELVGKLVVAGSAFKSAGCHPGVLDNIKTLTPEAFAGSPMEAGYMAVAPRPEDWPRFIAKMVEFDSRVLDWSAEDMRRIKAPTMVMIGDADIVRPEHAVELFRLRGGGVPGDMVGLPDAQLAILPGTTHTGLMFEKPDMLVAMISSFLDAPVRADTGAPRA